MLVGEVDERGVIGSINQHSQEPIEAEAVVDLRPWVLMPGLVDLHAHLPQLPNAGLGAGLDLLTWLERYIFPLERDFDEAAAERSRRPPSARSRGPAPRPWSPTARSGRTAWTPASGRPRSTASAP